MEFDYTNNYIVFKFQQEELTTDIKSLFKILSDDIQYKQGIVRIPNNKIADLNIHEIKKIRLTSSLSLSFKNKNSWKTYNFFFYI